MFDIDDQIDAQEKLKEFVNDVCAPLSDDVFDACEKF